MVVRDRECGEGLMVERRKVEGLKGDDEINRLLGQKWRQGRGRWKR